MPEPWLCRPELGLAGPESAPEQGERGPGFPILGCLGMLGSVHFRAHSRLLLPAALPGPTGCCLDWTSQLIGEIARLHRLPCKIKSNMLRQRKWHYCAADFLLYVLI